MPVEKVFIYNVERRWDRTRNVTIRLSNELPASGKETFLGGEALGSYKGQAAQNERVEIPSGPGWERKTGRFVIIQMNFGNVKESLNLREAYAVGIENRLYAD